MCGGYTDAPKILFKKKIIYAFLKNIATKVLVSSVILRKFLQQCWEFSPEFFKTFLNKIFVTTLSLSMFLKGAQWGLKVQGQPQQFFFRATLTSFSRPSQPGADTGEGESKGRRLIKKFTVLLHCSRYFKVLYQNIS